MSRLATTRPAARLPLPAATGGAVAGGGTRSPANA